MKKFLYTKLSNEQLIIHAISLILLSIILLLLKSSFPLAAICFACILLWGISIFLLIIVKKRNKWVSFLIDEGKRFTDLANTSKTITLFIHYYNQILKTLQDLKEYEDKVKFSVSPSDDYDNLIQWQQKHMQDALRRELHYKLTNTSTPKENYEYFCKELELYKNRFDNITLNVAEECKKELLERLTPTATNMQKDVLSNILTFEQIINNELTNVDLMYRDGWKFEQYCAELLLSNGFTDATVTQKTNDYGVDVIATNPDGVKYAIQCKCYSNKLGNTPVQEITAGMKVYNCQVGVVLTNNYFTNNAHVLAENNGILLWDRDKLRSMIETKKSQETNIDNTPSQPTASSYANDDSDVLLSEAIDLAKSLRKISTSMIQRRLGVGYSRACRLMDQMEARGIISEANGSKPRDVIV